jgi:sortase A
MIRRCGLRRIAIAICTVGALTGLATGFWIPIKAEVAQILLEGAWQSARSGDSQARPWPWADTVPVAKLTIPGLDASWVVLSGASGRNLAFAPTLMDGSARPGEPGVAVIAGHRDTHFEMLRSLETGDDLMLENPDGTSFRYQVTGIEIVDSRKTRIRLDADMPILTLVTCYPFDALTAGGPLRYIVYAS